MATPPVFVTFFLHLHPTEGMGMRRQWRKLVHGW
jgi:hypothetical protein